MNQQENLRSRVLSRLDMSRDIDDEDLFDIIDETIVEEGKNRYIKLEEKVRLRKDLYDSIRGLDILQEILEMPEVTEIMVNGPDNIFIEKEGKILKYNTKFSSRERLVDLIQQIVSKVNRRVNEASPIVDTRLADGSRINIVLNPIALEGPIVTIRKFPESRMTMEHLIKLNSINDEAANFLKILVKSGYNIFVSGGTGSGKTTFLNALSNYIPKTERIITIEDSAELQLNGIENLVRLEVRQANTEGKNEITIRELIRTALRMRPDRIVVGEVRGKEALDMLQAMNTGHDGSLSTGHANSPNDMINRLEIMVLMGVDMPISAIKGQIASGLDIIVHLGRLRDKTRKVLEIVEVLGIEKGEIVLNSIYKFKETGEVEGRISGELEKTQNNLKNTGKILAAGHSLKGENYGI